MFGLRVWHDQDLANVDAHLLELLVAESVRIEKAREKARKEASRG